MGVGKYTSEQDAINSVFYLIRNQKIFAVISYDDSNPHDISELEASEGVRELMECIELGRPYVEAMRPMLDGFESVE
tara:strand:+ start:12498 stop:12728 length:231 start_codon:yes stop_codon:yes gene_type:complete